MLRSLIKRFSTPDKGKPIASLKVSESHNVKPVKGAKTGKREKSPHAVISAVDDPFRAGEIRLNLGCGDKKLPGYINVDYAPSRKGITPDVMVDLRKLTFLDATVDEILSVHVIEHFYYWEAKELLNEWARVLKSGGRLVLECPNILSAAQALLDNPDGAAGPGKEGSMSMWALYGDPNWSDPLMCHKWGYTPRSLIQLLESVGFRDVHQEPAQFKKREPRDMRVVGIWAGRSH